MKKGVLLAASFSYGCGQADRLEISAELKEYVKSKGKSSNEKQIRISLSKLLSYFFYRIISLANDIEDPFDIRVVKAHWIGNELLEKVKPVHIKITFEEFKKQGWDPIQLAFAVKPMLKYKKYLHHNIYASHMPECSLSVKNGYIWHLKEARIKVSKKDIDNLRKYGRG